MKKNSFNKSSNKAVCHKNRLSDHCPYMRVQELQEKKPVLNILLITAVWPPKNQVNMYTDLMHEFSEQNHKVSVLALNEKRNQQDTYISEENGIRVLRIKCGNIQKTNKYKKVIASFAAGPHLVRGAKKYYAKEKFDLIIYALSTSLIVPAVILLKKRYHAKLYLLLKEFWPQDPVDLGAMRKPGFVWIFFRLIEKLLYKNADYIGAMSEAGVRFIKHNNKGVSNKLEVCPNSLKPREITYDDREAIRLKYGIPANKCVFIFGGNMGIPQGIDDMISCIRSVKGRRDIFFLLIGSGTEFGRVKKAFEKETEDVIKVLPAVAQEEFVKILHACDVGLLFLYKDYTVPNFPSRLTTYLAEGLPVIAAVHKSTDVGDLLEQYNCGIWLENGEKDNFKQAIDRMTDHGVRFAMSENSRRLFLEKFTTNQCYQTIMKHFIN